MLSFTRHFKSRLSIQILRRNYTRILAKRQKLMNEHQNNNHLNVIPAGVRVALVDNAYNAKKLRTDFNIKKRKINRPKISGNLDNQILKSIKTSKNASKITSIIIENKDSICHTFIFVKAMLKCDVLKDYDSIHRIMCIALESNIEINEYLFTVFLNSMAKSDRPELCAKYLHLMIKKYKIKPSEISLTTAIKSCRFQSNYVEAEMYCKLMTETYGITPTGRAYTEMISVYGKAGKPDKAKQLFKIYLQKVENNELEFAEQVIGAYLNVFCTNGDVAEMENVCRLMYNYGLEVNIVTISSIFKGFYVARKYEKCLETFDKWIERGNKPNSVLLIMKAAVLSHMIRSDNYNRSFSDKYKLYLDLECTIYKQMEYYGYPIYPRLIATHLTGAIFLYYNTDPVKIIEIFELLLDKKLIGYQKYDCILDQVLIDLHVFDLWICQFILRYLIGFKTDQLLKQFENSKHIAIVSGKGKHGRNKNKGRCGQFIIDELLKWDPPIKAKIDRENSGVILIDKKQLKPYLNNDMNFARQKLTVPSDDWYFEDPREDLQL